jgi:hypothetical protein
MAATGADAKDRGRRLRGNSADTFAALEAASDPRRARLYVAAVLTAGLAVAVLVVVLAGGGGASEGGDADARCLEAWNADQTAVGYGQHQFNGHGYDRVQVLRVDDSGAPTEDDDGLCAVVFAAGQLDPEPGARAQVLLKGTWTGLEALSGTNNRTIGELQSDAVAEANASLTTDGRLVSGAG